ncbi:hypothetical protein NKR19_g4930 [Coniochaeta hoffmannii]|uniref:Uncharacterized protein n=1 Tax=Coniochaeta hoffmannii TaxID=91930 RepID=A0AA38VHN2_9PEZI|nr:hypothetical protein NKR19_g4930 [Coniochaeta hoffmannii]
MSASNWNPGVYELMGGITQLHNDFMAIVNGPQQDPPSQETVDKVEDYAETFSDTILCLHYLVLIQERDSELQELFLKLLKLTEKQHGLVLIYAEMLQQEKTRAEVMAADAAKAASDDKM